MKNNKALIILIFLVVLSLVIILAVFLSQSNQSKLTPSDNLASNTSLSLAEENAASLASMPGSPEAPQQALVAPEEIPNSAIQLEVSADGFAPNNFKVRSGREVTLALTATDDQAHVFLFPTASLMGLSMMVLGGETKTITFTAPAAGSYEFRDDIPDFRENTGLMIVE